MPRRPAGGPRLENSPLPGYSQRPTVVPSANFAPTKPPAGEPSRIGADSHVTRRLAGTSTAGCPGVPANSGCPTPRSTPARPTGLRLHHHLNPHMRIHELELLDRPGDLRLFREETSCRRDERRAPAYPPVTRRSPATRRSSTVLRPRERARSDLIAITSIRRCHRPASIRSTLSTIVRTSRPRPENQGLARGVDGIPVVLRAPIVVDARA